MRNLEECQEPLRAECRQNLQFIDQVIETIHRISFDISPSIVEDIGLYAALGWLVRNFSKNYKIQATLDYDDTDIDGLFSRQDQIQLYRIFQEGFTNVWKHADANNISAFVKKNEDSISFVIRDDGKGFDLNRIQKKAVSEKGIGLAMMTERSRMLGGSLVVWSQEGKGTQVTVSFPVRHKDNSQITFPLFQRGTYSERPK